MGARLGVPINARQEAGMTVSGQSGDRDRVLRVLRRPAETGIYPLTSTADKVIIAYRPSGT